MGERGIGEGGESEGRGKGWVGLYYCGREEGVLV